MELGNLLVYELTPPKPGLGLVLLCSLANISSFQLLPRIGDYILKAQRMISQSSVDVYSRRQHGMAHMALPLRDETRIQLPMHSFGDMN